MFSDAVRKVNHKLCDSIIMGTTRIEDTTKVISLLLLVFSLSTEANHGVTGTPPSIEEEPQDMVVFAMNADMTTRASLNLTCNASGSPTPTITWFRNGARLSLDQRLTVNANGTLHIANITENTDAARAGTSYHCTARNKFGTIHSRTANISYAYFGGFTGPSGVVTVNVTTADDDEVALECQVAESNPHSNIIWLGNGIPLTQNRLDNRLRFLDNGRYLLIRQLTTAELNVNYQCQVTNARLHEMETSRTTYTLVNNIGNNEFMIYKSFIDRTVLRRTTQSETTVELSYIAGAGPDISPFVLDRCRRSGRTLPTNLTLVPGPGGVIEETIPRVGEAIPAVAGSVTFEVSCILFSGTVTQIPSQATITVQAPPTITMSPSNDFEKLVGQPVTFRCVVEGIPTPTVTWYRNGSPRGTTSVSGTNRNINTLTISSSVVGDTGMYQCIAENVVGKVQSSWALQVRAPKIMSVSSSSSDIHAMDIGLGLPLLVAPSDGGNAVLFAVVTADPCPTIEWRVNGTAIGSPGYTLNNPCSSPAGTTSFNFTLTITATSATAGRYTAVLTNPAGTRNVDAVFVSPPVPVVITGLEVSSGPRCLLSGTSVDIQCVNFGLPRPEIVFFRGALQIIPGQGMFSNFERVANKFDTIRLKGAQQTDGGQYVCEARDGSRQLNRSLPVDLVFCTHPTIVSLPAPDTNTEGMRFELLCTFTGIPAPNIHWEKDGSVFLLGDGRRIINSTGRSALEINSLLVSDAGVYTCLVSNVAGMAMRSVRLEVRVTGTPPSFREEPQDAVVFAMNPDLTTRASLNLTCMASGSPTPTITWFRNGASLSLNQRMTENANGTLHIVNITEGIDATQGGTRYHCTARNTFGTIRSRTAILSYAYFGGFTGPSGVVTVNVTTADDKDQVAIECQVAESNPPPNIRWLRNGNPLTENRLDNQLRFLDNGRYLLIRLLTNADLNVNYKCQVTNARLHATETSPTVYTLANNIGNDQFMIYKRFIDRTILRQTTERGTTVELSYIAGAGPDITPFILDRCKRSGRTLPTNLTIVPQAGGVIEEPIPRIGEAIPPVADNVTFEVSCILFSGIVTQIPSQTTITVQAPPTITMSPSNDFEKLLGETVTFTCVVEGIPTPTVTWYHNGNLRGMTSVSGSNRNINTLTISSSVVGDTGMYQCIAENVVGKIQRSWVLQVRSPKIMSVSSSSSDIHAMDVGLGLPLLVAPSVGGDAILFAVVSADPCPTIEWRVNGTAVSGAGYTLNNPCSSPSGTTSFNFTLTITATSARTGTYTAVLSNPAGSRNVDAVFVSPPVPVVITGLEVSSGPRCLLSGTLVDIQCVNFGLPRPEIVFFRGALEITPGQGSFSNFERVPNKFDTIRLSEAQQTDGGQYVCEARDGSLQLNQSQPVDLMFCTHPAIVSLPAPDTNTEGMRFELVCSFTGFPAPEIRWEKDGSVFTLREGRRIINSTGRSVLEINSLLVSDAGVYNCSVSNIAGMTIRSVRLEVRAAPPPSTQLPPVATALPGLLGLSPGAIAGIAVGSITGLVLIVGFLLLVFFCGVVVAARFLKRDSPPAPPGTTEISLLDNMAYERCNDQDNDHH